MSTRSRSSRRSTAAAVLLAWACASCGLPGAGSATRVDGETVPYGLLDPDGPTPSPTSQADPSRPGPQTFWLVDDAVVPEPSGARCADTPGVVVEQLLDELMTGPPEEARAAGRSTAITPDSELSLRDLDRGTAVIELDPSTGFGTDRLPAAVAQIVLTVASAPGVRSVSLMSDGQLVQMPLPDGVLTSPPVTAADYAGLVPDRFASSRVEGCPAG